MVRPDARLMNLGYKIRKLADQLSNLTFTLKKDRAKRTEDCNLEGASGFAAFKRSCLFCIKLGHGATRYGNNPIHDTRCLNYEKKRSWTGKLLSQAHKRWSPSTWRGWWAEPSRNYQRCNEDLTSSSESTSSDKKYDRIGSTVSLNEEDIKAKFLEVKRNARWHICAEKILPAFVVHGAVCLADWPEDVENSFCSEEHPWSLGSLGRLLVWLWFWGKLSKQCFQPGSRISFGTATRTGWVGWHWWGQFGYAKLDGEGHWKCLSSDDATIWPSVRIGHVWRLWEHEHDQLYNNWGPMGKAVADLEPCLKDTVDEI